MRGEAGTMTNIYKNIYLRKEEEVLYNIRKNVDEKYKGCPGYNTLSLMLRGSEVNE